MITTEFIEYVKKRRSQGISDIQIYKELKSHGWSKKDLSHVFHDSKKKTFLPLSLNHKTMSIHHVLFNKWSLSIFGFILIAGASVFYLFIYEPYHQLQQTLNAFEKVSSLDYSGKTIVILSPHPPVKSITLQFRGAADVSEAPTQSQSTISATTQGFYTNFHGQAEFIRSNQTVFLNISQLQNVPIVDPPQILNHWYIISSNSAQLASLQQYLPILTKGHLITITSFRSGKNHTHQIGFLVSKQQLAQLNTASSLNHITGTLWTNSQNLPSRLAFSAYASDFSHPLIQADIYFSDFNKKVTIRQPTAIMDIQSGTSMYYLLKILRSALGS